MYLRWSQFASEIFSVEVSIAILLQGIHKMVTVIVILILIVVVVVVIIIIIIIIIINCLNFVKKIPHQKCYINKHHTDKWENPNYRFRIGQK